MRVVVTGAGGFIGSHLVKFLKKKGHYVVGIDVKLPEWEETKAHEFITRDLRYPCLDLFKEVEQVYHLAADMGGIGYIETHKADIVFNNTMMNMIVLKACQENKVKRFLFSSSACVYPGYKQDKEALYLKEEDAYPADAEDGYGWEKLMMERACRHFSEDYKLDTRIARFHNIYGELGTYDGGREKSPAALCRKVALADKEIEIWGNGSNIRSYCHVDDCVEALYRLMNSNYKDPINIGTDRAVTINELADMIIKISGKEITKTYDLTKPQGVVGRNADITKADVFLKWKPKVSLELGLERTYKWIAESLAKKPLAEKKP